jgi:protein-disulfide isomerase
MHGRCKPLTVLYFPNSGDDPEQAGLDIQRARADIAAPALDAVVLQDVRDLTDLKVEKTPTFFVNGRPLSSFGHKQLADLVEQEVSKTKK